MGCAYSKEEIDESLHLCKERRRLVNQAIDLRCALAAAHICYIQSLRHFGIAMRRFAEAGLFVESPLSATELQKIPSPSSYPSPSPPRLPDAINSTFHSRSPRISPPVRTLEYMKSTELSATNFKPCSQNSSFMNEDYAPPPMTESGSWDFFYPAEDSECFRFSEENDGDENSDNGLDDCCAVNNDFIESKGCGTVTGRDGIKVNLECQSSLGNSGSFEEDVEQNSQSPEREDPSEYITHRAKDFLSSTKYIEHRFFRASDAGKDVTRLLEVNKLPARYVELEERKSVKNFTTWRRSISSLSYSSKKLLFSSSKDDMSESGTDFLEEFFMFAGSHSLTLDRLSAWERKLYDEVKASQYVRKDYDRKCELLRHQSAKDLSSHVIDKTRSAVKDLHSRVQVAIQTVDSISRRIERMRDDELLPQLLELIHGFVKMWKDMLECHHEQYITISLAYHLRGEAVSAAGEVQADTRRLMLSHLEKEIECFGLSFGNWTNSHSLYVDALNAWLHTCVRHHHPHHTKMKRTRPFSPRRALAPPIFVLLRDWVAGIRLLPSDLLQKAVSTFSTEVHSLHNQEDEEGDSVVVVENEGCIHTGLVKVLDCLTKFSDASVKMYEDILRKSEAAGKAYSGGDKLYE